MINTFSISLLLIIALLAAAFIVSAYHTRKKLSTICEKADKRLKNQKRVIDDLTKMRNEAIEYSKKDIEYFTDIIHDLRTPISVILGAVQLIEQRISSGNNNAMNVKQLRTIKQNCHRMLHLINNILDVSRISSGNPQLNLTNVDIASLTSEITDSVIPFAQSKGIKLTYGSDNQDIQAAIDVEKFERIMVNLLSNAIKFTERGGNVGIGLKSSGQSFILSVKDDGPGIPENMQDEIFKRFKQPGNTAPAYGGSGIGLSLVKLYTELLGGKITLNSEVGRGSEFMIEFPIKVIETEKEEVNIRTGTSNKTDLINIEFSGVNSMAEIPAKPRNGEEVTVV